MTRARRGNGNRNENGNGVCDTPNSVIWHADIYGGFHESTQFAAVDHCWVFCSTHVVTGRDTYRRILAKGPQSYCLSVLCFAVVLLIGTALKKL